MNKGKNSYQFSNFATVSPSECPYENCGTGTHCCNFTSGAESGCPIYPKLTLYDKPTPDDWWSQFKTDYKQRGLPQNKSDFEIYYQALPQRSYLCSSQCENSCVAQAQYKNTPAPDCTKLPGEIPLCSGTPNSMGHLEGGCKYCFVDKNLRNFKSV